MKRGIHEGLTLQQAPEYEDCRKIALQNNIPLKRVYEEVWKCLRGGQREMSLVSILTLGFLWG